MVAEPTPLPKTLVLRECRARLVALMSSNLSFKSKTVVVTSKTPTRIPLAGLLRMTQRRAIGKV